MKRFLAISAAVLLTACGKSPVAAPDKATDAAAAPAAAAGADRLPAYRNAVLALAAGSYGGQCNSIDGAAPKEGVTIDAGGTVTAGAWKVDLAAEQARLSMTRTLAPGAAPVGAFDASGGARQFQLMVSSAGDGSAMFGEGINGARCLKVASAAKLAATALYPLVAQFFRGVGATLPCAENGVLGDKVIQPGPAGVAFGDRELPFGATVAQEALTVDAQDGTLQYGAVYADQSHVELTVDAAGKLISAIHTVKSGVASVCSAAPKE